MTSENNLACAPESSSATPRLLVRFKWDCGRMGTVEGLFVTTQAELDRSWNKVVTFGEILGKHSDVYGKLEPADITVVTDDPVFIEQLVTYVGTDVSGYNPLSYIRSDDDE